MSVIRPKDPFSSEERPERRSSSRPTPRRYGNGRQLGLDEAAPATGDQPGKPASIGVKQAVLMAKGALEKISLTIVGEVSACNDKSNSAAYFTLAEEGVALDAMMWRDRYNAQGIELRKGMLVEVSGFFSVYLAKGRMQFQATKLKLAGEGELRVRVEQLARKLAAEGLMDEARKRPIPALPQRIGIVTSPRGKAVWDMIRTLRRRYPMAEVFVAGVTVEGERAAHEIVDGLVAVVNAGVEVILLGRGGGSYEDLMPFNDERLARTISRCPVPIVTGIGHEPDNTIADMVADLRCSTPTGAAMAVVPTTEELGARIGALSTRLAAGLEADVHAAESQVRVLASRPLFSDAHALLGAHEQGLDMLSMRLVRAIPAMVESRAERLATARERFGRLTPRVLAGATGRVEECAARLDRASVRITKPYEQRCEAVASRLSRRSDILLDPYRAQMAQYARTLEGLSPLSVLSRGYAVAYADDGSIVHGVDEVAPGDGIEVQVADGRIAAQVIEVRKTSTAAAAAAESDKE